MQPIKGRRGYRAHVTLSDGVKSTKQCRTQKEARAWIEQTLALDRSTHAEALPSPTVGEWLEVWLSARVLKVSPKTYANELSHARRYLTPLSAVALTSLTPGSIEDWLAKIERNGLLARPGRGQPHTVRICHSLLSSILRDAVKHRIIDASPMSLVSRPKVPPSSPKFLTLEELRSVLDAASSSDDPRAIAVELMAQLGLRRNEALGLVWSDIDLASGTISLTAQLGRSSTSTGSRLVRRELKTLTSRRLLALSEPLRNRLALVRASSAVREPDFHYVVTFGSGSPVDPDGVSQWLTSIGQVVGIKVSPHRLRHTAATLMLNEGVPIEAIGRVLGHSDSRTTRIYARVLDRSADAALGALADLLARNDSGRVELLS